MGRMGSALQCAVQAAAALSVLLLVAGPALAVSARHQPLRRLLQDGATAGGAAPAADGTVQGTTPAESGPEYAEPYTEPLSVQLFTASGVAEQLAANGTVATIFAPKDTALTTLAESLGLTNATDILSNATLANITAAIVPLHVVPGEALYSTNLTAGETLNVTSLAGIPLAITLNENGSVGVSVVGAEPPQNVTVVTADIPYNGSVVHVIDGILLPPPAELSTILANAAAASGTGGEAVVGPEAGAGGTGTGPSAATGIPTEPGAGIGGPGAGPGATTTAPGP